MRKPLAAAIALVLCQSAQAQTPPRQADLLDSVVVVILADLPAPPAERGPTTSEPQPSETP